MKLKKRTETEMRIGSTTITDEDQAVSETQRSLRAEEVSEECLQADRKLVDRCLAGEVAAWEEFYAQCHDPLCTAIRIILGRSHGDANLVDEIAARVWYALVADDGALWSGIRPRAAHG